MADETSTDETTDESTEELSAAETLLETLYNNPTFVEPARVMLQGLTDGTTDEETLFDESLVELEEINRVPLQPLVGIMGTLVRYGAVEEVVTVNGAEYEGSSEDAYTDEDITDEDVVATEAVITEVGTEVLALLQPPVRMDRIFEMYPDLADGFLKTLELCNTDEGLSTAELFDGLDAEGLLYRNESTDIPTRYPSTFANLMRDGGGIEWHDTWITTDAGREYAGL